MPFTVRITIRALRVRGNTVHILRVRHSAQDLLEPGEL